MTASVRALHDAVWPLLDAVKSVAAYDGAVPKTPPIDPADGTVNAYAVLYVSAGRPAGLTLDGTASSLFGGFQVTCVGGDPTKTLWCLDKVRKALLAVESTIGGRGPTIPASELNPAVLRRDDDVAPPRHYVADRYEVFIP